MQARRRLVEEKEDVAPLFPVAPRRGQVPGQLEALGLAAAQGRHRLAESQVPEAHRPQRLQPPQHLGVAGEECQRFGYGQLQHLGDRFAPSPFGALSRAAGHILTSRTSGR